ncbi:MAG: hypothetical protein K2Q10_03905, partial [Rhodospirillales bacterium]|nr:hypothetical protein [Rhodospirillales bacterium]
MPRRSSTPAPRFPSLEFFTAGRTIAVPAGVTLARFTALGGGASGGGGLARAVMTVSAGQQIVVSVGGAGHSGADGANGSNGGNSTILVGGVTLTASGGKCQGSGSGGGTGSISSMSGVLDFVAWSGG